jgi:predicted phage tail protein
MSNTAISLKGEAFIKRFDRKMNIYISSNSSDAQILRGMALDVPEFRRIVEAASQKALNQLCDKYKGFHYLIELLASIGMHVPEKNQ